jgi:Zn-dependent protease with chaperone function
LAPVEAPVRREAAVAHGAPPLVDARDVRANRRRARRISVVAAAAPAVVVGAVLAAAVSPVAGGAGLVVVLVLVALIIPRMATGVALRVVQARPVRDDELPRLQNLVDGLCPTFGVRRPTLMAVDDEIPNACSLGIGPDRGVLVVTTGLEAALDLTQMEGVVGHELSHLKRDDTLVSSVAVTVLAPVIWLTGGDHFLHRALGRGRELRADQVAVTAVRYPPGLCDALRRFAESGSPRTGSVFTGRRWAMSRWLWIDPAVGDRDAETMGDLDLTSVRINALAEL